MTAVQPAPSQATPAAGVVTPNSATALPSPGVFQGPHAGQHNTANAPVSVPGLASGSQGAAQSQPPAGPGPPSVSANNSGVALPGRPIPGAVSNSNQTVSPGMVPGVASTRAAPASATTMPPAFRWLRGCSRNAATQTLMASSFSTSAAMSCLFLFDGKWQRDQCCHEGCCRGCARLHDQAAASRGAQDHVATRGAIHL
eukprot:scaffold33128_cov41-Prasinocladus_malaysianus.AAC.2